MRKFLMIPITAMAVLITGCQEQALLMDVNPDGSGTILVRMFMNVPVDGGMFGAPPGGEDAPPPDMSAQSKQMVESIGEGLGGVELKDSGPVTNAKGWKGYKAVYAFNDINQVILSSDAKITNEDGGTSMSTKGGTKYTFKFTPGSPATLQVIAEAEEDEEAPNPNTAQEAAQQAQMMQMMAPMLAGMRISGMIQINGSITDTNAELLTGKNKNVVVLYDIQMDKVLKNPKLMKLMQENPDGPKETVKEDGLLMQSPKEIIKVSFQ